jgi:hypothetical protein
VAVYAVGLDGAGDAVSALHALAFFVKGFVELLSSPVLPESFLFEVAPIWRLPRRETQGYPRDRGKPLFAQAHRMSQES